MYDNVFTCKHNLIVELIRVQRILEGRISPRLRNCELELRKEIEKVLKHEELLWFQKSRSNWLLNRDRNTKYSHSHTLARHRKNKIEGIKIEVNE